jgi:hypothetical protein
LHRLPRIKQTELALWLDWMLLKPKKECLRAIQLAMLSQLPQGYSKTNTKTVGSINASILQHIAIESGRIGNWLTKGRATNEVAAWTTATSSYINSTAIDCDLSLCL